MSLPPDPSDSDPLSASAPDSAAGSVSAPARRTRRADVDLPVLLERYWAGETIAALAKENKVHRSVIYYWLLAEQRPEYYEIITKGLVARVAEADALIDEAQNRLDSRRARDKAYLARQDLERRRPELYGRREEVKTDSRITVTINRGPMPMVVQTPQQISTDQTDSPPSSSPEEE